MIKLGLIAGLFDNKVKSRVLEKMHTSELTVDEVLSFVQQIEQVSDFANEDNLSPNYDIHHAGSSRDCTLRNKIQCFICKKYGHLGRDCRSGNRNSIPGNRFQKGKKITCFKCKRQGHYASDCHNVEEHVTSEIDHIDVFSIKEEQPSRTMKESNILIDGKSYCFPMQEDTGSGCTILSSRMWEDAGNPV